MEKVIWCQLPYKKDYDIVKRYIDVMEENHDVNVEFMVADDIDDYIERMKEKAVSYGADVTDDYVKKLRDNVDDVDFPLYIIMVSDLDDDTLEDINDVTIALSKFFSTFSKVKKAIETKDSDDDAHEYSREECSNDMLYR